MRRPNAWKTARFAAAFVSMLIAPAALCSAAYAQPLEESTASRYRMLHSFEGGADGSWPTGQVVGDPDVALFGLTTEGGKGPAYGNGTVYRLRRTGADSWKHDVVFDAFSKQNGFNPQVLVAAGDRLIGATHAGGKHGAGVIFELRKRSPTARRWEHAVLHSFTGGDDGAEVQALVHDEATGAIYGATSRGGDPSCGFSDGCGVIFAMRPDARGGDWSFEVIHNFAGGAGGWRPWGDALAFADGALYGTTHFGGVDCVKNDAPYNFDCGTVYRLDPPGQAGGAWTKTLLHSFTGKEDGARPSSSLVVRDGAVYGTTIMAGAEKRGTVFRVGAKEDGADFSVIYAVKRTQSYIGGLTAGAGGALYAVGEGKACANVFSLRPVEASETYAFSVLKKLREPNGCFPDDSLRFVASENALYGATWDGGAAGEGTIYRLPLPESPTQ